MVHRTQHSRRPQTGKGTIAYSTQLPMSILATLSGRAWVQYSIYGRKNNGSDEDETQSKRMVMDTGLLNLHWYGHGRLS